MARLRASLSSAPEDVPHVAPVLRDGARPTTPGRPRLARDRQSARERPSEGVVAGRCPASGAPLASEVTTDLEARVRGYMDACTAGDAAAIASHLTADAEHYFPPDMYDGPWRGGE